MTRFVALNGRPNLKVEAALEFKSCYVWLPQKLHWSSQHPETRPAKSAESLCLVHPTVIPSDFLS